MKVIKQKPIYVQTNIETDMDTLWTYTQNPDLHTEWDARFTEITYLPKQENEPQPFLYKTKIGFGLEIAGTGESVGEIQKDTKERISALKFGTDSRLSLIRSGRGYWKYKQENDEISFETQYDYETNFGKAGQVLDRFCFRPLLGWATAWSFDALKMWLEKGYHPRLLIKKTLVHWLVCFLLAFVWIYQGLVPKVIATHPVEIKMLEGMFPFPIDMNGVQVITIIGMLEILFAFVWLLPVQKKYLFIGHFFLIFILMITAVMTHTGSIIEPFNPVSFNMLLLGLSIIGYVNCVHVPKARRCQRHRKGKAI